MSANDRTGVGAGSAEWGSPPDLFARLHRRFRFTYDAFASHENALCGHYSTAEGTWYEQRTGGWGEERKLPPMPAAGYERLDGLTYPWTAQRVFMNPPYSRGLIEQCIEKAYSERDRAEIIVALLPAATEVRWFQQFILPHCHIDFLSKRVRYIDPVTKQPGGSPPSGAIVAVFKSDFQAKGAAEQ